MHKNPAHSNSYHVSHATLPPLWPLFTYSPPIPAKLISHALAAAGVPPNPRPAPACAEVPAARNALGTLAIPCAPELAATHQGEPWYRFHETHAWCPIASEDLDKAWILAHHW